MKRPHVSLPVAAAASILLAFAAPAAQAVQAATGMLPSVEVGPRAKPADIASPKYGLFTCQVGQRPYKCYDPYEMRRAYGTDALIANGYDGTGQTIAIVDAFQSPNIVSELSTFDGFYGLPNPTLNIVAPDGLTPFVPGDANMTGWAEEISLDVEWAHAIAPHATIELVLAKTNDDADILSAGKYAVDHNLGDVISMSFGENESCMDPSTLAAQHQVFADATRKGITLFASSGDQGAALQTCDGNSWVRAASSPASDPLVTAVGGTELNLADYCLTQLGCNPDTHPPFGTRLGEVAWNEGPPPYGDFSTFLGTTESTGGGFSVLYDEPAYQEGTIHGGKQRGVPDVAYSAAIFHGVLTYLDIPGVASGFYIFGGTSAGSPQWSALIAIANQKAGHDLGFLNRGLYQISHSNKKYASSFFDITDGTNSAIEVDSSNNQVTINGFDAGPGWDATTGLGSPAAVSLVNDLIQGVSPGDGNNAISNSKPHLHGNAPGHGHQNPH